jgi:hypothetical protein
MALRRMFSMKIVDTDAFLDMPLSTQALYFHLAMRADDDGFVSNPKKIVRMLGVQEDELKVLFAKKFIIGFENGVVVIKHWKIHNYIQNDRYTPTTYTRELAMLGTKDNGGYTLDTERIQIGDTGKVRIGKDRLGKDSIKTLEEQIEPFRGMYSPSMITDFLLYWEESDAKSTPRWKKERTWDLSKRLLRWQRQQEKWDYEKSKNKFIATEPPRKSEPRTDGGFSKISIEDFKYD